MCTLNLSQHRYGCFIHMQNVFPNGKRARIKVCVLQYVLLAIESQHLNGIILSFFRNINDLSVVSYPNLAFK